MKMGVYKLAHDEYLKRRVKGENAALKKGMELLKSCLEYFKKEE